MSVPRSALAAALVVLLACQPAPAPGDRATTRPERAPAAGAPPATPPPPAETLTFGTVGTTGYLLRYGIDLGLFTAEGIAVELLISPANTATAALIGKQVDATAFAGPTSVNRLKGAPIVTIAHWDRAANFTIYASPEIHAVRDLVGKRVGLLSLGSTSHIGAMRILQLNGVDPSAVMLMGAGQAGTGNILAQLRAGALDAANVSPPLSFEAEREGFVLLAQYGDYVPMASRGLSVHEDSVRERSGLLKRLLRANLRTMQYVHTHRDEAIDWLTRNLETDRDLASRAHDFEVANYALNGMVSDEVITNEVRYGLELGLLNRDEFVLEPTAANMVDYRPLREVLPELGLSAERP